MAGPRTPEQIRDSIERNRAQFALALEGLRSEVDAATDWRRHLRTHRKKFLIGAAVGGFILGGGIGATVGAFRRG